ncbi:PilZ domain-containing protein [Aliivibrio fischeri]|uniref:PilZ domain-containing protein n=1 Tax=Aliivibrio fischeri TaxID=668 RepID=UPI0012D9EA16|nr:PilZ domain-containing protein [Aliivibrio fischeri]MUK28174.1 PilZ domain-containing protein [Aliivibrio fischeri]MUK35908.1 PilZ domain-containing protein [Aliivibrio fischeri]
MIERRKFSRVIYQADIALIQGAQQYSGSLIDLSLHGLLIKLNDDNALNSEGKLIVHFALNDSDINIIAECEIVNDTNNLLRLCIRHIDIDSISHLKRLVELNVGNSELLLRQLSELTETH